MILQPPDTCVHYGQACRTDHSTKSSYKPPLHHDYLAVFPGLTAHQQPSGPVNPVHIVQSMTLQAENVFFGPPSLPKPPISLT